MTYREHRIRGSLQSHVSSAAASDPEVVAELQRQVYHADRGIYFTKKQLAAMPWDVRGFIEAQGRRIFGPRRGAT